MEAAISSSLRSRTNSRSASSMRRFSNRVVACEADGVFEHGRQHIGARSVLIKALGGLEKEGERIEIRRPAAGGQAGRLRGVRELGQQRFGSVLLLRDFEHQGVVRCAQPDLVM